MIVAVPDDRIAPWLTLHPPWVCLAHPLLCSTKRQKICTPYTARVCICIGITSTFQTGPSFQTKLGLAFCPKALGAMIEGTASLPCLFLIFYTNPQKKARKSIFRQSDITRKITQYAGSPPRPRRPAPSDCRSRRQSPDLPRFALTPSCADTRASWCDPSPSRPASGRKDPARSAGP